MSGATLTAPLAALALAALLASGCSSTREQAKRFAQQGSRAFAVHGLRVTGRNRSVRVLARALVTDANGTAAALVLRNDGHAPLANVPLALAVRDARGRVLWRNDAPGLEASLTHAALLPPGKAVTWVDDQVTVAGGRPASVAVRVGAGSPAPAGAPAIAISGTRVTGDPASGLTAGGVVANDSGVAQQNLVVAAVARRGGRIVAAGRALVPFVKAHGSSSFQAYFIGDPAGAQLALAAQPTTLR
jgi:hypothetical protein